MFGWLFKFRANKSSSITAQQLQALLPLQDAVIVDVREPSEYAQGHITSALNRPLSGLAAKVSGIPQGKKLYVICQSGMRSARAAGLLRRHGYADVVNVRGGMNRWTGPRK
ncbi:rhodanese-like domain-containing protein [Paenibacillus dendritiformis]|uniref:rhodanese-like domain-containing protein n=1 Tax=Paenibacillus dendritiformis TaxID=130049 RepID=UPI00143DEA10|nr:rhodanese-like domain-containing protein [Paenibacillus dendritiformis]NKI22071.1 rhodanese-like domain-containing protein [Paenibacillus dendritiformis]NRF98052.1 rhodanese-like domain-containing protein [Paenibacillus dendritiformis]